jgi:RNA polymerase sigma factor (sigma-70 family)
MNGLNVPSVARDLETLFTTGTLADQTDSELLDQFLRHHDEVAFGELVARHGPLVLRICRRSLHDPHDIEDAFQAVFLILVRKARTLTNRSALASWLFGVAIRVARRTRKNTYRRRLREHPLTTEPTDRSHSESQGVSRDLLEILNEEIERLPEKQHLAVILCLCQGHTHQVAARELNCPVGTVKTRIATARRTLTRRLTRRGLTPSVISAILGPGFRLSEVSIPSHLLRSTIQAAAGTLTNPSILTAVTSAPIAALVQEVLKSMLITRIQSAAILVFTLTTIAGTVPALLGARQTTPASRTQDAPQPAPPKTDRYGDPLPPGAAMRLGTIRYRNNRFINHIAYSPYGQVLVTDDRQRLLQLWDPRTGNKLRQIDSGLERIRYFAFSPDGRTIAVVGSQDDQELRRSVYRLNFIDFATGRRARGAGWTDNRDLRRVFYAPDGKTIATANVDGSFRLWDVATLELLHHEKVADNSFFGTIAFSPDPASHLLAFPRDRTIHLWDTSRLREIRVIPVVGEERVGVRDPEFSPDGAILAAQVSGVINDENRGEFWLWKVSDGTLLHRCRSTKSNLMYGMTFSRDGNTLFGIGNEDQVISFDVATGKELILLADARAAALPLVFSPDGSTLTTIAGEQVLHFWDTATGQDRLATPDAHSETVRSLQFDDGGKTLISTSHTPIGHYSIRFWNLETGLPLKAFAQQGAELTMIPGGPPRALFIAAWDTAELRDLQTDKLLAGWGLSAPDDDLQCEGLAVSRDGSSAIATFKDGSLKRWDTTTGKELPIAQPKLPRSRRPQDVVDVDRSIHSADGQAVVLLRQTGLIQVVDVPTGTLRFQTSYITQDPELGIHIAQFTSLEFAPDSQSLAFVRHGYKHVKQANGDYDFYSTRPTNEIVWLDAHSGQVRREIEVPGRGIGELAFSPDGEILAACTSSTASNKAAICLFRLRDKKVIQTIETPSGVTALTFTPNGTQMVAALSDTSIVLWNVQPIR